MNWFIACKNGNEEIVKLLLKKSLKINGKENSGATALFIGIKNCRIYISLFFLFKTACKEGHEENVELLLQNGANVNSRNSENCTSLMIG